MEGVTAQLLPQQQPSTASLSDQKGGGADVFVDNTSFTTVTGSVGGVRGGEGEGEKGSKIRKKQRRSSSAKKDSSLIDKRYSCPHCEKSYSRASDLRSHARIHTNDNPFKCDECGKVFGKNSHLIRHRDIHTSARPWKCGVCGKSCKRATDLQVHLRTHTGERPYNCKYCPKRFVTSSQVRVHERTHDPSRRHPCSFCWRVFKTPLGLKNHVGRLHPDSCVDATSITTTTTTSSSSFAAAAAASLKEELVLSTQPDAVVMAKEATAGTATATANSATTARTVASEMTPESTVCPGIGSMADLLSPKQLLGGLSDNSSSALSDSLVNTVWASLTQSTIIDVCEQVDDSTATCAPKVDLTAECGVPIEPSEMSFLMT